MVTSATQPRLEELLRSCTVLWQLWPQHAVLQGERRQIGFEVELIGSHTLDPCHLDPGCAQCRRLRSILVAIAEDLAHEVLRDCETATYDIDPHPASIVCLPGLANRPCVTVGIIFTDNHAFDRVPGPLGDLVVSNARDYLAELGIAQR